MKISALFVVGMLICSGASAQQGNTVSTTTSSDQGFENFCLLHATSIITLPEGKGAPIIAGEVATPAMKNPTYKDYGVSLKENEAQYFSVKGTNQLLKVESVFRLRLMYNQSK